MADDSAPQVTESTHDIMRAFISNFPELMNVTNAQVRPQAEAKLATDEAISPRYAKLLNDLYSDYGTKMAQTGVDVERINRQGAAETDLGILRGTGGDLAREAVKIDKELNPEFYDTRANTADSLKQLLGSLNLDAPDVEAERLVNQENIRTGNQGNDSASNTVANALQFGDQRLKRQNALSQAISTATNFLQPSQGQFNPVVTALNRPSTNAGETRFEGVTKSGDTAYNMGQGMFNNLTSLQGQAMDINANRRDTFDRIAQGMSSVSI